MKILFEKNAARFLNHCEPLFSKNEALNSIIWGICSAIASGRRLERTAPLFIRIQSDNRTVAAAIKNSAHGLLLTSATEGQITQLAQALYERGIVLSRIVGPSATVEPFVNEWKKKSGTVPRLIMHQKIYELRKVNPPAPTEGKAILAKMEHAPLVEKWMASFAKEAVSEDPTANERFREAVPRVIEAEDLFLWEKSGEPVSCACLSGPTANGVRVSMVYTPHEHRRHGYAGNLVAWVSQHALNFGKRFCVLYTDEGNPTSNRIYQEVGYRVIGEAKMYLVG